MSAISGSLYVERSFAKPPVYENGEMTNKATKPPTGLGTAGRALWRKLHSELPDDAEFDERELALLALACKQTDDVAALEAAVKKHGRTVRGSTGQVRVHPALSEIRQGRLAVKRLLDQIELTPPTPAQQLTSQRARQAVGKRWARERARRLGGSVD
jgi:P27 family predicted phage terminase small subunit